MTGGIGRYFANALPIAPVSVRATMQAAWTSQAVLTAHEAMASFTGIGKWTCLRSQAYSSAYEMSASAALHVSPSFRPLLSGKPLSLSPCSTLHNQNRQNGIGNIRGFSPGRSRIVNHRFEHLRSCNTRLTHKITLLYHHLLGSQNFNQDFNAQITSGYHDTIRFLQNGIKVINPSWFSILDIILIPESPRTFRISWTSEAFLINEAAMKSTPCSIPNKNVLAIFSVKAGKFTMFPGKLIPLVSPSSPEFSNRHRTWFSPVSSTLKRQQPIINHYRITRLDTFR